MRVRNLSRKPVLLGIPGGAVLFEPGQTLDLVEAFVARHVGAQHLEIVARGLAVSPLWALLADDVDETPAVSASKPVWVAYAATLGWTEEEANAATKAQLIQATTSTTDPAETPGQE